MIFVAQNDIFDQYGIDGIELTSIEDVKKVILDGSNVVKVNDSNYYTITDFFDLIGLGFKVVVDFPSAPTMHSILSDTKSDRFIRFQDFMKELGKDPSIFDDIFKKKDEVESTGEEDF